MFKINVKAKEMACAIELKKVDEKSVLWHRRMGHANFNVLKSVLDINVTPDTKCVVCAKGKHASSPFSEKGTRAIKLLERIHSDVCGPFQVKSMGGSLLFVSFIDDFSRKAFVYPLKSKSDVFSNFVNFKNRVENETGMKIKNFRRDNGKEFDNGQFDKLFAQHGIKREKSVRYRPQQNGVAERYNRTIMEKARCMLIDAKLTKEFWAEAVCAAR